ncbi:MAG: ROK family protein [Nitrospirae bacterium]|nr:ROK family protein [Nitrospirota bacterium]
MKKHYAIGIDLGSTNLRAALVSEEGEVLKRIKAPSAEGPGEALMKAVGELFADGVLGIGCGAAGLIDTDRGLVIKSPNLPAIEGAGIFDAIREKFGVPVFVENNAKAAALGEKWRGEGRAFRNFVLISLGTGIGGGIIYNDSLLDAATELGHMSIIANGEKCSCGSYGCLELYASAKAMVSRAVTALEHGSESILKECCHGNIYKVTPGDIYAAALDGDTFSREILREAGRYLGVGIASVINIFSPEAILLSGGLVGAWNIYVQEAIKEASRRAFKELFERVKILPSSLGDDAGVLGSSYLVFLCRST